MTADELVTRNDLAKITTTQIYAKVLDEGRKKAVDAIPDL